jgi:exo-beta-1,3-glucanase (GH17 family)
MFSRKIFRAVHIVFLLLGVFSLILAVSGQSETPLIGINYGPFRADQSPGGMLPSEEEIAQDLKLIADAGFSTIRIYSVGELGEPIVRLADEMGLKVIIQAWIDTDRENNQRELDAAIELANAHSNVVALLVGSEVLLRNDVSVDELLGYIRQAHGSVRSGITVSYADVYNQWEQHPELAEAVDWVGLHSYAFHSCESVEFAAAFTMRQWEQLEQVPGFESKEIVILETGWPTKGGRKGCEQQTQGSDAAQAQYVTDVIREAEAKGADIFLFEFADEPWKCFTGDEPGYGCHWGLVDVDRSPKPAWEVVAHPPSSPELTSEPSTYAVTSDVAGVNCRAEPNLAGSVVMSVQSGTPLEISERNDECWYSAQVGGSSCWMHGYFIVDAANSRLCSGPPPIPTVDPDDKTVPLQPLIDSADPSLAPGNNGAAIALHCWTAVNADPDDLPKAMSCLKNMQEYVPIARNQQTARQAECSRIPQGPEHSPDFAAYFQQYYALSDVSVAYWVAALVLRSYGYSTASHEAAQIILNEYSCAMIWDPQGWFWPPAQGVRDRGL